MFSSNMAGLSVPIDKPFPIYRTSQNTNQSQKAYNQERLLDSKFGGGIHLLPRTYSVRRSVGAEKVAMETKPDRTSGSVSQSADNAHLEDCTPGQVFEEFRIWWLNNQRNTQSGLQSYESNWKQFKTWMDSEGYKHLTDLPSRTPVRYQQWLTTHPDIDQKPISRAEALDRIRRVIEYAESMGYARSELLDPSSWETAMPAVRDDEEIRSDPLSPEKGVKIFRWIRENKRYSRADVLWTLVWRYGLRVSAIRALDKDHLILKPEEAKDFPSNHEFRPHIILRDRPELGDIDTEGLPLKNTNQEYADRRIPLHGDDAETLRGYVDRGCKQGAKRARKTHDDPDGFGLYGLVTTEHSARISRHTIHDRVKWITCPTTYTDANCVCEGCQEYREENGKNPPPSKVGTYCDKARSPHQCRHGAITNMLNSGIPIKSIARTVGTSPQTIRDTYDRADEWDRMDRIADDLLKR